MEEDVEIDAAEEQRQIDELIGGASLDPGASTGWRERARAYFGAAQLPLEDRIPAAALMRLLLSSCVMLGLVLAWRIAALSGEQGHLTVVLVRVAFISWLLVSVELCRRGRVRVVFNVSAVFLLLLTYATTVRTMGASASSNFYVTVVSGWTIVRASREIMGFISIVAVMVFGIHVWFWLDPVDDPLFPYYGYVSGGLTFAAVMLCVAALAVMCVRLNTRALERAKERIRGFVRAQHRERVLHARAEQARANTGLASGVRTRFLRSLSSDVARPLEAMQAHVELLAREVPPETDLFERDLERLQASMAHLRLLVSDVLAFSAIEAQQLEPSWEQVSLDEVCAMAEALIAERFGQRVHIEDLGDAAERRGFTDRVYGAQLLAQFVLVGAEVGDPRVRLDEVREDGVRFTMTLDELPEHDPRRSAANSMADFRSAFLQELQLFLEPRDASERVSGGSCFLPFRSAPGSDDS